MLPLLRYYCKDIKSYTGVDINDSNSKYLTKRVTNGKAIDADYYPFDVSFVRSNVADMSMYIDPHFDVVLYMSSIEHMHKDVGIQSLLECRKLISDDGIIFLTCPNTPEDQDGYDTQYAAHVYEWKTSELREELCNAGFDVVDMWGILANKRDIMGGLDGDLLEFVERLSEHVPRNWLLPVLSAAFTDVCKEVAVEAVPSRHTCTEEVVFTGDEISSILGGCDVFE